MKKIISLLLAGSLVGCLSQATVDRGDVQPEPIYTPAVGNVSTVSLGDRMMFQAYGYNVDCIAPAVTKSTSFSLSMSTLELRAGEKMCGDAEGTNLFRPDYKIISGSGGQFDYTVVEVKKRNGSSDLCMSGYTSYCLNYLGNEIERVTEFKSAMNSLQRTIEYMGRDGDVVTFLYTEFKDGMARSAFNREFVVDLTKGSTMNFKGAVVEIINATNTSLEYRVDKYFN